MLFYVQQYPEIAAEVEAIELSLEAYSQLHATQLPANLTQKVLQRIKSGPSSPRPATKGIPPWIWLLSGLAILLASWFFWQNQQLHRAAIRAQVAQEALAADLAFCDSLNSMNTFELEVYRNKNNQIIAMAGTELSPDCQARVFYDEESKNAYFSAVSLNEPPSDQDLQLWALVDGQPVDMGVIPYDSTAALLAVPFIEDAGAFAITLEPLGGSPSPTLENIALIGQFE